MNEKRNAGGCAAAPAKNKLSRQSEDTQAQQEIQAKTAHLLQPVFADIPQELQDLHRWVCWKAVPQEDGRISKVPLTVKGHLASSTNEKTWTTFAKATAYFKQHADEEHKHRTRGDGSVTGTIKGVGVVLNGDGLVGVDLDHQVDEDGELTPTAREIIKRFHSYAEISPSGTGVRIFCRGTLPPGGRKRDDFEVYESGRYLTVTGHRLNGVDIVSADDALAWFHKTYFAKPTPTVEPRNAPPGAGVAGDDELLRKAEQAKNGDQFKTLWDGDFSGFPSQNEADLALANRLAFWTGKDPQRMDQLFRRSGLYRANKWDRSVGGNELYGQRTIRKAIEGCTEVYTPGREREEKPTACAEEPEPIFPRIAFPSDILPPAISQSLQCLARSCACSFSSLPGAAFCMMGAALGRTVAVSPKRGWQPPLIFWHADIRDSGEGKTPAAQMLAEPFHRHQKEEHARYKQMMDDWKSLKPQARKEVPEPEPPRAYFITDLTLEGVRNALKTGHGGVLTIQDELSAVITGADQYKGGKGNDRESWLKLWDGSPAHVIRASFSLYLEGARLSLFGGIQPSVFRAAFDPLRQTDGTLFRFLLTYEPPSHRELTCESWAEMDRATWENTIERAMAWADQQPADKQTVLMFDQEAQTAFLDWRNEIDIQKLDLPPILRGFLPKAYGYALRLTGVIHCLHAFADDKAPAKLLSLEDFERGRKAAMFYLGQVTEAVCLLADEDGIAEPPIEISDRTIHLAKVLEELKAELDSGRLAVGYIKERFNTTCEPHMRMKSSRAMGALLRTCRLSVTDSTHDANGKRAVRCLTWDKKTNNLIETCLQSLQSLQTAQPRGEADADIEKTKSAKSARRCTTTSSMQTLQTLKKQSLQPESVVVKPNADNADNADVFSTGKIKCVLCSHLEGVVCRVSGDEMNGVSLLRSCEHFNPRSKGETK